MKKPLAVILLLIALAGIAVQARNVNTHTVEDADRQGDFIQATSLDSTEESSTVAAIENGNPISYYPFVSQAGKKTIPYIIVELKNITINDDTDPSASGEIEIGAVAMSGRGVAHILTWPIKVQDSSWFEANTGNTVIVNAPIFCEREDEMSDVLAIVIAAVDNDEIPEWISKFADVWFEVAQTVLSAVAGYGPLLAGVSKLEEIGVEALLNYLSEAEQIGVHGKALIPLDWSSGYLAVTEQSGNMIVNYEIRRVQVPVRTPPVSVKLLNVEGIGDEGWGDDADSEPFIHTRVLNNLTVPEQLVQRHDFGPIVDVGDGETWTINKEIFRAEAVGPFLHVEIDVWEEDDPDSGDDNDMVGIYSQTFYPDENWGIGNTIVERRSGIDEGDVWIRFEIIELPFHAVGVTLSPTSFDVEPGYTVTFNVTVTNMGNLNDTYTLSLSGLTPSWYAFSNQTVSLSPSETTQVFLNVTPTRHWSTAPGDYDFTVTATSIYDPEATDSDYGTVTILPFHETQLFVVPNSFWAQPGDTVTYTTGVQNLGNVRDDYNISAEFLNPGGLFIDPRWTTIWPYVFWGLDPGNTGTGYLEISVPEDWAATGLEEATYSFTIFAVCQADPTATDEVDRTLNVTVGIRTLSITLSGEFDYAFKEPVTIKISALVKDIKSRQPISGAHITIDIYAPNGDQLWSDQMIETSAVRGLYIWESDETIQDIMKGPHWQPFKGVYTVSVEASFNAGPTAYESIEFHIDPPAESFEPFPAHYVIIGLGVIAAASIILLTKLKPSIRKTKSK
mgnify:CR=1 FL=1